MGPSLTDVIVDHAAAVTFASLPPAAVSRAKARLLDACGLIVAGTRAQGSSEFRDLVVSWGGRADSTVITTPTRVPAFAAAMSNAVLMRSYDFEPVGADRSDGKQIPAHITGTTVSVALAVGEAVGASGQEVLKALIVGDDIAARLGHAVGFDVYGGGDNTGTINVVGGAVVAGLLYGFDREQLRRTIGIAINQVGGTIDNINDKTLAFKMPIAFSARNAVQSAGFAAVGFGGPQDPIGGRFGFLAQWSDEPNPDALSADLGQEYFADAVLKPWPSCRASQPSITAAVDLVATQGVEPADIREVRVHVHPRVKSGFVGQEFVVGESPEVSAAFSIRFGVATALLAGSVLLDHMTEEYMRSTPLQEMISRIDIRDTISANEPSTAEVEVVTAGGEIYRVRAERGLGDIHFSPQGEARLREKYDRAMAWGGVSTEASEAIHDAIQSVESLGSLRQIVDGMAINGSRVH
ncbi:MAG: MmgE/PrpD family protein [Gulosibacter sp.]|uniref:MmgE/PrpD family protein n=1 Tax=Gulosibacter sp. TaxID=2817531 RepID=UPI003F937180